MDFELTRRYNKFLENVQGEYQLNEKSYMYTGFQKGV